MLLYFRNLQNISSLKNIFGTSHYMTCTSIYFFGRKYIYKNFPFFFIKFNFFLHFFIKIQLALNLVNDFAGNYLISKALSLSLYYFNNIQKVLSMLRFSFSYDLFKNKGFRIYFDYIFKISHF